MRKFYMFAGSLKEIPDPEKPCWIDILQSDEEDYAFLTESLKIPDSFIEDIMDNDELSRTESEGEWMLTILRIPIRTGKKDGAPYVTVPLGIICNNDYVITICNHRCDFLYYLMDRMRKKKDIPQCHLDLIFKIIYTSTSWFLLYLREINKNLERSEAELERSIRNEALFHLRNIQKSLVYFNTSIKGNMVTLDRLGEIYQETDSFNNDLMQDVLIEIKQAENTVKIYSDILTATMDTFTSIISNNLNVIMKRMTGFSIALMLPTLVASFYGMNVSNGAPDNVWSFVVIVCASMFLSVISIILFKKIKWF